MTWFTLTRAPLPSLDDLVEHYERLMRPKPGKRIDKALKEIARQRSERLENAERLRLEAAALFALAQKIEREASSTQQQPVAASAI